MNPHAQFHSEQFIAELNQLITTLMEVAEVPGLAVSVVKGGAIVWERGFGVKSAVSKGPVDAGTVFEAASLSKPIFAYAALQLCRKGLLDLDTPLVHYDATPYTEFGFAASDQWLKDVTTRQVLSHSAGFGNWLEGEIGKINFTPGGRFLYSGEGYIYLQRVIEHLTGEPLASQVQREVLEPFGMRTSSYTWQERYEREGLLAHGHGYRNADVGSAWSQAFSAFSLYTTARDYAMFLCEMLRAGAGDEHRLSADMLKMMITPQIDVGEKLSWGLGWGLEETPTRYFWHWGDLGDYTSFVLGSRANRDGLVILTNSETGLSICERITQQIIGGEHPCFANFLEREYDILSVTI